MSALEGQERDDFEVIYPGKRVDFSARTVISPDPNLRIDQVGVPTEVARTMTYPERVSRHNLQHLRSLIINGPKQWPGANYVEKRSADLADGDRVVVGAVGGGHKKSLNYGDRNAVARDLKVGDVVERHMRGMVMSCCSTGSPLSINCRSCATP